VSPPTVDFRNVDLDVMRALAVVITLINHFAESRQHPCSESRETLPLPQHRWREVLTTAMCQVPDDFERFSQTNEGVRFAIV